MAVAAATAAATAAALVHAENLKAIADLMIDTLREVGEFKSQNGQEHTEIKRLVLEQNSRLRKLEEVRAYVLGALAIITPILGILIARSFM
jgi:uncharacterized protein involved in exopolysaccharide biosynthesis